MLRSPNNYPSKDVFDDAVTEWQGVEWLLFVRDLDVLARVPPRYKLTIVKAFFEHGSVVAGQEEYLVLRCNTNVCLRDWSNWWIDHPLTIDCISQAKVCPAIFHWNVKARETSRWFLHGIVAPFLGWGHGETLYCPWFLTAQNYRRGGSSFVSCFLVVSFFFRTRRMVGWSQ